MARKRWQEAFLAVLIVVLAGVTVWRWQDDASGAAVPPPTAPSAMSSRAKAPTTQVPGVALGDLQRERPEPVESTRDPFRFEVRRPPPPPPPPPMPVRPAGESATPTAPLPPPPPPPIPLKFIGIVDTPSKPNKLAVLSDGREVYHGREGDIIDGRYRILRIGVESIEMAYLDGRGRTTIRLTGS